MLKYFSRTVVVCIASFLLLACGGGGNGANTTAPITAEDEYASIYNKLLTDQRFTSDFYSEPANTSDNFYTIKHITNHDIANYDVSFSYPMCANDYSNALTKADIDNGGGHNLIADEINNNYFEFSRSASGNFVTLQRIYRCDTYSVNASNNYKGQYQVPSVNTEDYKHFIEYQWYFSFYNNYGNVVLHSETSIPAPNITRVLITSAHLQPNAACDEITIKENYYDLDHVTREIERYSITSDIFFANKEQQQINIC